LRRVIVTGDDFGLAVPVNEAIVEAHRRGILTTASLMVGGDAAQDAVARAREVPSLNIGLHLVLVLERPVLPVSEIPDIVDSRGRFSSHFFRDGLRFFFSTKVQAQLEREIRAQFEAFAATGFSLDHVNTHNHMQLHPTVAKLMFKVAREYGVKAVRLPYEPLWMGSKTSGRSWIERAASSTFLLPWVGLMRTRTRRLGIRSNDYLAGMHDSGAMTEELVLRIIKRLPNGITEIYFHPSMRHSPEVESGLPGYRTEEEFKALTSPVVGEEFDRAGIERISFSDI